MMSTSMFLFSLILWSYAAVIAYAVPSSSIMRPRDATSQPSFLNTTESPLGPYPLESSPDATPAINASALIRNRQGVDITSSFQVKVYNQASRPRISNSTEENNLNNRQTQTLTQVIRLINECYSNETFVESHCTPDEDEDAALGAYVYTCRKVVEHWRATGEYMGFAPAYQSRHGRCEPNEVCVEGFGTQQIASCVHTSLFDDYTIDKNGRIRGMLNGEVFDVAKAWAVISKTDQSTAMTSKRMGIATWNSAALGGRGTVQSKRCRNCADLETDVLAPDMDSLRLEATLMSTGAVAGILWLAMGAG